MTAITDIEPISKDELHEAVEQILAEGGPFAVVPKEIRGVHYERVFALSEMSLRDVLAAKTAEFAASPLIVYGDERYTTGEVWARSMRFANWLGSQGIGPGDNVAIAMRNYPEWCMAFIGVVASGATVVPLNSWWQAEELRYGVETANAKFIVVDAKRCDMLAPLKEEFGLTLIAGREEVSCEDASLPDIINDESISTDIPSTPIDPESVFALMFTSGSTGFPKAAELTHRGVLSTILSWSFVQELYTRVRPEIPTRPDNAGILLALPLFHVTALHSLFLLSYLIGRKVVFVYKWDPEEAASIIKKEKLTNFVGVPTMAQELIKAAKPGDLDTLVDIGSGGAKRPAAHVVEQGTTYPEITSSSGYGLTETNALGTIIGLADYARMPDAAGRVVPPITQLATFSEDGKQLPDGEIGEVCIRSPGVMKGYLNNAEASAEAFFPDGWFRTGDVGVIDENGYLTIMDRLKDMIIRGGENISCLEVENILLQFEGVTEAAVFAVHHERLGEAVGAAVYGKDGPIDPAGLQAHAKEHLAAFKVPTRFWLSPQPLPRGATGKTDKKPLRAFAKENPPHFQQGDD
ncbi:MAG: class I adenylate-forming enzyme family protein [Pseudomonadota bacterium]